MTHNHNYRTVDHSLAEAQVEIASRLGIKPNELSVAINERDNIIYASANGASTTYDLGKMRDNPFRATVYAKIAAQLQHAAQRGDKG